MIFYEEIARLARVIIKPPPSQESAHEGDRRSQGGRPVACAAHQTHAASRQWGSRRTGRPRNGYITELEDTGAVFVSPNELYSNAGHFGTTGSASDPRPGVPARILSVVTPKSGVVNGKLGAHGVVRPFLNVSAQNLEVRVLFGVQLTCAAGICAQTPARRPQESQHVADDPMVGPSSVSRRPVSSRARGAVRPLLLDYLAPV